MLINVLVLYLSKNVTGSSITLYRGMDFFWGRRSYIYIMLSEKRKKCNSAVASRSVEVERYKKKQR